MVPHDAAMNGVAFLLVLALLAQSVCAQLTVAATGTLSATLNPGSAIQQVTQQPVTGSTSWYVGHGSADLSLGPTTTLSIQAVRQPLTYAASAAADVRLLYGSPVPVAGLLRFTATTGPGASSVRVDVDDDGQLELSWSAFVGGQGPTADVPVVLGPAPLAIEVDVEAFTFAVANIASASLTVQFLPQANLSTSGVACGATIGASMRKSTISADGRVWLHFHEEPFGSDFAAVLFGVTPLPMGISCGPGLDESWFLVTPSPTGIHLPIVLSIGGLGSAYVQYVGLQLPDQLRWSNRIGLTLP